MPQHRCIAIDFDATLAEYDVWRGPEHLGAPVERMVEMAKQAITEGAQVFIFTARVYPGESYDRALDATKSYLLIAEWSRKVFGTMLPITYQKLPIFTEIWDDRAKQVLPNQGVFLEELLAACP